VLRPPRAGIVLGPRAGGTFSCMRARGSERH
jgi:hypothetical protein